MLNKEKIQYLEEFRILSARRHTGLCGFHRWDANQSPYTTRSSDSADHRTPPLDAPRDDEEVKS